MENSWKIMDLNITNQLVQSGLDSTRINAKGSSWRVMRVIFYLHCIGISMI